MRGRGEHALAIAGTVNGKQVLTALSAGSSSKPSAVMPRVADRYGRGVDADGPAAGSACVAVSADRPYDRTLAPTLKRPACRSLLARCPRHLKRREPRAHDFPAEHGSRVGRYRPRRDSLATLLGLQVCSLPDACVLSADAGRPGFDRPIALEEGGRTRMPQMFTGPAPWAGGVLKVVDLGSIARMETRDPP